MLLDEITLGFFLDLFKEQTSFVVRYFFPRFDPVMGQQIGSPLINYLPSKLNTNQITLLVLAKVPCVITV